MPKTIPLGSFVDNAIKKGDLGLAGIIQEVRRMSKSGDIKGAADMLQEASQKGIDYKTLMDGIQNTKGFGDVEHIASNVDGIASNTGNAFKEAAGTGGITVKDTAVKDGVKYILPSEERIRKAAMASSNPIMNFGGAVTSDIEKLGRALKGQASSPGQAISDIAGIADKYTGAPVRNAIGALVGGNSVKDAVADGITKDKQMDSENLSKNILSQLSERRLIPQPTDTANPFTGEVDKEKTHLLQKPLETAIDVGADVTNLIPGKAEAKIAGEGLSKMKALKALLGK